MLRGLLRIPCSALDKSAIRLRLSFAFTLDTTISVLPLAISVPVFSRLVANTACFKSAEDGAILLDLYLCSVCVEIESCEEWKTVFEGRMCAFMGAVGSMPSMMAQLGGREVRLRLCVAVVECVMGKLRELLCLFTGLWVNGCVGEILELLCRFTGL